MKKEIVAFCIAVVMTTVVFGASTPSDTREKKDDAFKHHLQNHAIVMAAAKGMREGLPKRIDHLTQWIDVKADKERLIYLYKVKGGDKSDEQLIKEGKERMTRQVQRGACQSARRFLKNGITLIYRYIRAENNHPLFDVVVFQTLCNQLGQP